MRVISGVTRPIASPRVEHGDAAEHSPSSALGLTKRPHSVPTSSPFSKVQLVVGPVVVEPVVTVVPASVVAVVAGPAPVPSPPPLPSVPSAHPVAAPVSAKIANNPQLRRARVDMWIVAMLDEPSSRSLRQATVDDGGTGGASVP